MRRLARTFVRTDAAADDVVQETWLGVIRGLAMFERRSSLRTWIFRILVNQARTRATRDAGASRSPRSAPPISPPSIRRLSTKPGVGGGAGAARR